MQLFQGCSSRLRLLKFFKPIWKVLFMDEIREKIQLASTLNRNAKPAAAQNILEQVMRECDSTTLLSFQADIDEVIQDFLPRRRKDLEALFASYVRRDPNTENTSECIVIDGGASHPTQDRQTLPSLPESILRQFELNLRRNYKSLSIGHIFRWRVYTDDIRNIILDAFKINLIYETDHEFFDCVFKQSKSHSTEIFEKGLRYWSRMYLDDNDEVHESPFQKSEINLVKLIGCVTQSCYDIFIASDLEVDAFFLRRMVSSIISGFIFGYGNVKLILPVGEFDGWKELGKNQESWMGVLGYLRRHHLENLLEHINGGLKSSLMFNVLPVTYAIDRLVSPSGSKCECAVIDGVFESNAQRLWFRLALRSVESLPQNLDIYCFLRPSAVSEKILDSVADLRPALVTAPLPPSIANWKEGQQYLREIVVNTTLSANNDSMRVTEKVSQILSMEVGVFCGVQNNLEPLTHNFAADFPLDNPHLAKEFLVKRGSVKDLLRTLSHQNGVRVWCSIRRSGKTTSFFEMDSEIGYNALVVKQTCDHTDRLEHANLFYDRLKPYFDGGRLPSNFFEDIVFSYMGGRGEERKKIVFVLDEYETLFGDLYHSMKGNAGLRYSLVQPLFNQMVSFSRDNLIIFLGQRPDAYLILSDQNQLSPMVKQDSFPLFAESEFKQLLRKVFQTRSTFDDNFSEAIYKETSGHPFLTINLLIDFVDWLIEKNRPTNDLRFSIRDFERFAQDRLNDAYIDQSPHYQLFRTFISEALSEESQKEHPWLYSIYAVLQRMSQINPESFSLTKLEFEHLVRDLGIERRFHFSPAYLLSSACQSNFLSVKENSVQPGVRLLARISRRCLPRLVM